MMGQNNIAPTGEDSVLGVGPERPEASDSGAPVQNSPGNSAAGPVGATPTRPNPYKVPGGSGADAALENDSNVEVRSPYNQAEPQASAYVVYGNAPKPLNQDSLHPG